MSTSLEIRNSAESTILKTYNRFPVVLDHGEGVYLYDTDGKQYLDFAAGIAVESLGYHYPGYDEALIAQIGKINHISNLYYSEPMEEAGRKVLEASGMSRIFFTNSGTEAIEGAMKAARRYSFDKYGAEAGRNEIIAMNHSFHGRSMGALSVTGTEKYQIPFRPLVGGVTFAEFNDLESVKAAVTEKTCAIIMETVQGEGGIYPATAEFLQGVRALCDEKDIVLILDEIQCGMGRTGYMFAWMEYGVEPDIMTSAKALGCGVPVGAFLLNKKLGENSMKPGDHGTTYGGNPFVCAAISKVMDIYKEDHIVDHVKEVAPYLEEKLDALVEKYDCIATRRGKGLMQGLVLKGKTPGEVVNKALEEGLIVISAGADVLRMVPPLVIEKKHVDEMIAKLEKALA